jgi:hypothetical protein
MVLRTHVTSQFIPRSVRPLSSEMGPLTHLSACISPTLLYYEYEKITSKSRQRSIYMWLIALKGLAGSGKGTSGRITISTDNKQATGAKKLPCKMQQS